MKRSFKRVLAMMLCAGLFFGAMSVPASAAESRQPPMPDRLLYQVADTLLKGLLWLVNAIMHPVPMPRSYETSPDFYAGMDSFLGKPASGAGWRLGYARASLIPGGLFCADGKYIGPRDVFVGGAPKGEDPLLPVIHRKVPTFLHDDNCVRVTALSDGSGRGTVIFASLDAYALTSYDVRIIRGMLRDFARQNHLVSINIGVLHQHSAIDTLGFNGPLLGGLFINPWANLFGLPRPYYGKNPAYMAHLHETVTEAIKQAVRGMEPGELRYGAACAENWIHDRRAPRVMDDEMHRLRFVPANKSSRETWILNLASHTVGLDADTQQITGDFPHYIEERVNEQYNANFMMILSGQLAINKSNHHIDVPGEQRTPMETIIKYGYAVAGYIAKIEDEALAPLLNIKHAEYVLPVDNPLHLALFRSGMIESTGVRRHRFGPDMDLITEVGYMELGGTLAVAFIPGEICPVIYLGGASPAAESFTGEDFIFTPMKDMVRGERKFLAFTLMNDHSGYILAPNDIQNFVLFGNEEINQASVHAAELLLDAFKSLTDSVK